MQKFFLIIGAALLLGGVGAAGTFASLGSGSDDTPSISTEPLTSTNTATTHVRREDRRQDRATEARGRANEAGEDARGRAHEPGGGGRGREGGAGRGRGGPGG